MGLQWIISTQSSKAIVKYYFLINSELEGGRTQRFDLAGIRTHGL